MLIATVKIVTDHSAGHVLISETEAGVAVALVTAGVLAVLAYVRKRLKTFFDNIEDDHKTVQAHDALFKTQVADITETKELVKTALQTNIDNAPLIKAARDNAALALETSEKSAKALTVLIAEVKPNGGKRRSAGDTVARSEQKIDELIGALQTAGVIPELSTDTQTRDSTPERIEHDGSN